MRALVIDDSRVLRRILKTMLSELHFQVDEAANGREGMAHLQSAGAPDLVLLDWNMPQMNGIEFVRAVRALPEYAALPIVMVTTETEIEQVSVALAAGVNEYVMKPFERDALVEKLQQLGILATT